MADCRRRRATTPRDCRTAFRDDIKPLEITQPDGPSFDGRGQRGALAEVALPRRLQCARGPGAAHRRLRGRRHGCARAPSRVAVGDGGALRRSRRRALPQERLRRRRIRHRRAGELPGAGLRLPRRHPLFRRLAGRQQGRAATASRTRSACTRRISASSGSTPTCFTGEVEVRRVAPPGDLVDLDRRELRIRLLLVPLPGRLDPVRDQADRHPRTRPRCSRARQPLRHASSRPDVYAHYHQHIFNMRLDMDGRRRPRTGCVEVDTVALPVGPENPLRQRVHHP